MNKSEVIDNIAQLTSQSKADSERALEAFVKTVSDSLARGDEVKLIGFGTFAVSERSARVGRNPQTGAEIQIPARKAATFRPGKELKSAINP